MKKVGIVTINDYDNYGNRLQNYALQQALNDLGFETLTVKNVPKYAPTFKDRIEQMKKLSITEIVGKVKNKVTPDEDMHSQVNKKRSSNFMKFTNRYIAETDYTITEDSIPNNINNDFAHFVAGSDQIWNPNFRFGSPIDFLTFAPVEKRMSYAASFAIEEVPEKYKERYTKWLTDMPNISVRENAGAAITKRLTGKEAFVHVDPTLLISKEQWLEVAKPAPEKPKSKFLLTYFLNGMTEEQSKVVNKISKKYNLEVVNMADKDFADYYTAGPSEFLDYIASCEIFLSNSFHGVVFSMLFEKPFIIFKRGNMNSRINTLLEKFKLSERKIGNLSLEEDVMQVDFSHVHPILAEEKEISRNYLLGALNPSK